METDVTPKDFMYHLKYFRDFLLSPIIKNKFKEFQHFRTLQSKQFEQNIELDKKMVVKNTSSQQHLQSKDQFF